MALQCNLCRRKSDFRHGATEQRELKSIAIPIAGADLGECLWCQSTHKNSIEAAVCYYPSSTVLEFLQLLDVSQTSTAQNRTAIPKNEARQYPCRELAKFLSGERTWRDLEGQLLWRPW